MNLHPSTALTFVVLLDIFHAALIAALYVIATELQKRVFYRRIPGER